MAAMLVIWKLPSIDGKTTSEGYINVVKWLGSLLSGFVWVGPWSEPSAIEVVPFGGTVCDIGSSAV
jgi:hypothetical protein